MPEETGISLRPRSGHRGGFLRRAWTWCHNHKLLLTLLTIILIQQGFLIGQFLQITRSSAMIEKLKQGEQGSK